MDITRIEPRFIKENQLVGLGFPDQGYVFWKVHSIENIFYENYTESPGTLAAGEFDDPARLPMDAYSIDNLLRVESCDHLYQVFMGWSPGVIRRWTAYPFENTRGNLDVKAVYTKSPFGYIDGYESPSTAASPQSELWIPKDIDVGFAWYNPTNVSEDVMINMLIRRISVRIIRDADLVEKILKGTQPCRLVTLGGISGSIEYRSRQMLDVGMVSLDATRDEIEAALS
ncbi:MAG: hypothetical protein DRP85_07985 [Candidatus Makaraimicrobium thalassicum]|nr:MAG: hypothetical protein DRP85_07985 [Candidatus Omnitrophota bacterium]